MDNLIRLCVDTIRENDRLWAERGEGLMPNWLKETDEGKRFVAEFESLRARIARLQAEVKAWRHWNEMDQLVGTEDETDVNANSAWGLLELDRAAVDQHKDLESP